MRGVPGTEYVNIHKQYGKCYYRIRRYENGKPHDYGGGRTLIEVLMMRDWIIANGWKKYPKVRKWAGTGEKHISYLKKSDTYIIHKNKNTTNSRSYYGSFKTLNEAISHRDFLIEHNWDEKYVNVNKYNRRVFDENLKYIKIVNDHCYRVKIYKSDVDEQVGTFDTLEKAIEARDLYLKYDGDWDLICEYGDTGSVWLGEEYAC